MYSLLGNSNITNAMLRDILNIAVGKLFCAGFKNSCTDCLITDDAFGAIIKPGVITGGFNALGYRCFHWHSPPFFSFILPLKRGHFNVITLSQM